MIAHLRRICSVLLCAAVLLTGAISTHAATYTVGDAENVAGGILAYKESGAGVGYAQDFIDTYLCQEAGVSAEWYVLTLSQSGSYDFQKYEKSLLSYLNTHEVYSATSRQKYALALICAGSTNEYIYYTLNDSIGRQGVMSYIFGLHLLNNGYPSRSYTADAVKDTLLSMRTSDGGWAVMGSVADTDVTAMALCALAPFYGRYTDVTGAVDRALSLLSSKQNADGGYSGFGGENCESTAQVLCALSCLGIHPLSDSRFIKNGSTVLDGLMSYRLSNGAFSHTKGGADDESATVQAYYALVALLRMQNGRGSLYLIDSRNPSALRIPTEAPKNTDRGTSGDGKNAQNGSNSSSAPQSGGNHQASQKPNQSQNGSSGRSSNPQNTTGNNSQAGDHTSDRTSSEPSSQKSTASAPAQQSTSSSEKPTLYPLYAPKDGSEDADEEEDDDEGLSSPDTATPDGHDPAGISYKVYAIAAAVSLALILCAVLFILKKRNRKNFIFIAAVTAVLILLILLTDFSSKESYYREDSKDDIAGQVTISIRCDTITDETSDYIPQDGEILKETEYTFSEGETVYDILLRATKEYTIHLDTANASGALYVRGINHLYEFDYGELSGWMYRVNGETPSLGCAQYTLSDHDEIEWLYTKDIGQDLL